MKIQIFSDLHFETFNVENNYLGKIHVHPEAEVVVLAGDIDNGVLSLKRAVELVMEFGVQVILVPGNHEFYGKNMYDILSKYNHEYNGVTILTGLKDYGKSFVDINGVRFVGGTIWSNFKLYEHSNRMPTQKIAMDIAGKSIYDFFKIRMNDEYLFSPQDAVALHELMLENINSELDKPFEGKKVLITHHGVHSQSVHPKYQPNINSLQSALKLPGENSSWMLNPYFVSNLPDLLKKVDVAIHGHTHESLDYNVGGTRVITNPRGYPFMDTNGDIIFENKMYKPFHIFEI